jgi:hypothetical protein
MVKLSEEELKRRAKLNYFDENPNIDKIFVNEFGQFSYSQAALEEPYKHTDVKVFAITRKGLEVEEFENKKSKGKDKEIELGEEKTPKEKK